MALLLFLASWPYFFYFIYFFTLFTFHYIPIYFLCDFFEVGENTRKTNVFSHQEMNCIPPNDMESEKFITLFIIVPSGPGHFFYFFYFFYFFLLFIILKSAITTLVRVLSVVMVRSVPDTFRGSKSCPGAWLPPQSDGVGPPVRRYAAAPPPCVLLRAGLASRAAVRRLRRRPSRA